MWKMRSQLLHRGRSGLPMWQLKHLIRRPMEHLEQRTQPSSASQVPSLNQGLFDNLEPCRRTYMKKALAIAFRWQPLSLENYENPG